MQQYKELVQSRRFVLIVLAALTWLVNQPVLDSSSVLTALTGIFSSALGVGVIDKFGEKIGGK